MDYHQEQIRGCGYHWLVIERSALFFQRLSSEPMGKGNKKKKKKKKKKKSFEVA